MGAETSPVKAPSLLEETFWPAMATREPFTASTAGDSAVSGGAAGASPGLAGGASGRGGEEDAGVGTLAGGSGDGFGHFQCALGESRHFEYAHGTVPDDRLCRGDFQAIGVDGLGTDIEPHPAVGGGRNGQRLCSSAWFEFGADDVIDRQEKGEFLLLRFAAKTFCQVELVVFDERLPDGLPFGF